LKKKQTLQGAILMLSSIERNIRKIVQEEEMTKVRVASAQKITQAAELF